MTPQRRKKKTLLNMELVKQKNTILEQLKKKVMLPALPMEHPPITLVHRLQRKKMMRNPQKRMEGIRHRAMVMLLKRIPHRPLLKKQQNHITLEVLLKNHKKQDITMDPLVQQKKKKRRRSLHLDPILLDRPPPRHHQLVNHRIPLDHRRLQKKIHQHLQNLEEIIPLVVVPQRMQKKSQRLLLLVRLLRTLLDRLQILKKMMKEQQQNHLILLDHHQVRIKKMVTLVPNLVPLTLLVHRRHQQLQHQQQQNQ
mmetsp:Transcript_4357/g.6412  ORF Transcript_4357/g.6412 Transcript_4357/m.6412 type:complete len:253 (-) Transcript_4357:1451-2209(-)